MAKIYIIDDDSAADLLVDNLTYRGHTAKRIRSVEEALSSLADIARSDLVVLDLVMPHISNRETQADGFRSSGMIVYRQLRETSKSIPIIVYTANQDAGVIDAISSDAYARYVPRWSGPSLTDFISMMTKLLGVSDPETQPNVFIVHGQDEAAKYSVKNFLQNVLNLPEPVILHEQPNQGRTVIEKFEDLAGSADIVFVIMTPDDRTASASDTDSTKRRARQNVILELGYFLGLIGRRSGRIFLLYKGNLELPSDIAGLIYLNINNGIEAVGEQIRRELLNLERS